MTTIDHNPPRPGEPTTEHVMMLKFELYKFSLEHDTNLMDLSTDEMITHLEKVWQWMLVGEVPTS